MSTTCTGHGVTMFALLSMKGRFYMELAGMKGRGPTMYSVVKKQFGFKGTRQAVYDQFVEHIKKEAEKLKPGEIVTN